MLQTAEFPEVAEILPPKSQVLSGTMLATNPGSATTRAPWSQTQEGDDGSSAPQPSQT